MTVTLVLFGCSGASTASTAPAVPPSGSAVSPVASATTAVSQQTFTGYLVDQACGVPGVDIQDGSDLTKTPEKHQLTCARMPGCLASGFGLFIKQADGAYKYYTFDTAGSKMAIDDIINKTTKADNFLVDVAGTMNGSTITVASITLK